jgi:outer membrane lipase/esterase
MLVRSSCLALFALLLSPALATAAPYTNLVVFGDSLSDQGNAFLAVSPSLLPAGTTYPPYPYPQIVPGQSTPYFNGRFSNGPIWVDTFAAKLGLSSAPALLGGTNYAFGGALTSGASLAGTPSLAVQVGGMYLLAHPAVPAGTLLALWGGANDIIQSHQGNPAAPDPTTSANNIKADIQALYNAGGREFLVFNLPDIGKTPYGASGALGIRRR